MSAGEVLANERTDVAVRVSGLSRAVEASRGRLDDELLDPASSVVEHANERLRLSSEHTIIALAGATGSGKSSLFNTLTDLEIAGVGVKRPTTSWALACAWGPEGASDILDWIGIPARQQVSRMSMLDTSNDDTNLRGLVLLDLPDHDSTEVAHHLEVDRLVEYADLLVWVLDPQKYADAAIHERYLKPYATHSDVMIVVLNQIDLIPADQREAAVADVRRLLVNDGVPDPIVLTTSTVTGDGLDDLRRMLVKRIRDKQTARERIGADVRPVAERLAEVSGTAETPVVSETERQTFRDSLADSVGIPTVVELVRSVVVERGARMTSWPIMRLITRPRKDPGHRIGAESEVSSAAVLHASMPELRAQRGHVDSAVRDLAEHSASDLTQPWVRSVRSATTGRSGEIVEAVDDAVRSADLGLERPAPWMRTISIVQWLLLVVAVVGIVWGIVVSVSGGTGLPDPELGGVSVPLIAGIAALVAGIVLGIASRVAVHVAAKRKAREADGILREAIGSVADEQILAPLDAELRAYDETRAGLRAALTGDQ
ncbi:MAG TPA: GTPase [Nocardioidaceae bacterium]|nr:GTPase [Nocardioidaceae bacterium]